MYLDNSATTRVRPEVVDVIVEALTFCYGNPSSLHRKGMEAEQAVHRARKQVSQGLGCDDAEIVFTSGGTESNNMAVKGAAMSYRRRGNHIITTQVEHPSVLNAVKQLEEEGFVTTLLKVNSRGIIDLEQLENAVKPETVLVSIMAVNNEIGTIQPVDEAVKVVKRINPEVIVHTDAVQAFGKIPINVRQLGVDLLSISAHKIYGPKGVGALFIRKGVRLKPLLNGGEQEGGRRSGTENVPGILGLGLAAELALKERRDSFEHMNMLKARLWADIKKRIPIAVLNGPDPSAPESAPHILNVSFPGIKGEVLVHALEDRGIYVSTGSACSSRQPEPSHVLKALGLDRGSVEGALRFSLSPFNTPEEMDYTVTQLAEIVNEFRRYFRR